jgi:hypothetical protein
VTHPHGQRRDPRPCNLSPKRSRCFRCAVRWRLRMFSNDSGAVTLRLLPLFGDFTSSRDVNERLMVPFCSRAVGLGGAVQKPLILSRRRFGESVLPLTRASVDLRCHIRPAKMHCAIGDSCCACQVANCESASICTTHAILVGRAKALLRYSGGRRRGAGDSRSCPPGHPIKILCSRSARIIGRARRA